MRAEKVTMELNLRQDIPRSGVQVHPGHKAVASRQTLVAALFGLFVVRLVLMIWLPLTDTTEARYAEIARKMVETGDWITPQFDYGVPFWAKPPLHTWVSAIGMKLFGVSAFAARLPILMASIAVLAAMYVWVRRLQGPDTALVAITVCASSLMFFGVSAFVMTDMVMVLGTTLSMVGFYTALQDPRSSSLWGYGFFVGLAIGMLAKGPTAVVLTGIPIVLWLIWQWNWRLLLRLPWVSGTALMLALTVPWYIAAELKTPGFLEYFLIGEHIQRFIQPGWQGDLYGSGHREPKGMIWLFALAVFLPWTFLVAALAFRPADLRKCLRQCDPSWMRYLSLWVLSPLILFTPAANILAAYVLPAVPAFSALVALVLARQPFREATWVRISFLTCLAVSLLTFTTITGASRFAPELVGLRTKNGLVATVQIKAPGAVLSVYPKRSYSAEFYARGAVQTITDIEALAKLARNNRRDAVLVPVAHEASAAKALGIKFDVTGRYRKFVAFLERAP